MYLSKVAKEMHQLMKLSFQALPQDIAGSLNTKNNVKKDHDLLTTSRALVARNITVVLVVVLTPFPSSSRRL